MRHLWCLERPIPRQTPQRIGALVEHAAYYWRYGMAHNSFSAVVPRQTNLQHIAHHRVPIAHHKLVNVNEPGEQTMRSHFAEANWRLEQSMLESKHHRDQPGKHHLNPEL